MVSAKKNDAGSAIKPAGGAVLWRGEDLKNSDAWIHHFTPGQITEIEAALQGVRKRGLSLLEITRQDFPLPGLSDVIEGLQCELEGGRGFHLLRGLPVDKYSPEETEIVYWGLGTHLGQAVSQDFDGHIFGHVYDRGSDYTLETARGYQTNRPLNFHSDSTDVVGLLCYRKAKSGGESLLVSSMTLHNEMLEQRPDLLEELYRPFCLERKGEPRKDRKPYYEIPVFSQLDGQVTSRYNRAFITRGHAYPEVPSLTDAQTEALDMLDALARREDLCLVMDLQLGDIQWVNNYATLHGRNDFADHEEEDRKRHMLRLWLTLHKGRRLPDCFLGMYSSIEAGQPRTGFPPAGAS
ncbi:MAG: TauD/TfdA family dioxygenase [SAR324 cluster bacterium]|nr:TauD/TfdA family dioxygenase [SAR324 cluster bacterium]